MSGFIGSFDNSNTSLDFFFGTCAVNDKGFIFINFNFLCEAKVIEFNFGKVKTDVIANKGCAGKSGNIKKHFFSSVAEAGAFYAANVKGAAEFVDDKVGKSVAFDVFGNDKKFFARFHGLFKNRNKFLERGDFFLNKKNGAVFDDCDHLVGVGYHIRRKVAAVKFHTFNNFDIGVCGFGVFNGDDTVGGNSFHCVCNEFAEFGIAAGDGCNSCNILGTGNSFCVIENSGSCNVNCFLDAAFYKHGVCACGYVFHTFANKSLCKDGCGGGTVACCVVGFFRNFFNDLCTHILERIRKRNFFCDGNTVVANHRSSEFFIENNVASFRTKGNFYSIGELVNTCLKGTSCVVAVKHLFCHI